MPKLKLSVAMGDYDRTRPLIDGSVQIEGVDPIYMTFNPEEMFFRAFRNVEFDISELSFSSYVVKTSNSQCPYTAVPVFLSRAFRHTSIYVRRDRVKRPEDLKGRRIGVPEYQLTAIVWARAVLQDDFGVAPEDVIWVQGGINKPGRPEKLKLQLPKGIKVEEAPEGDTLSQMLDRGDIDGYISPRPPGEPALGNPDIGWLFPDTVSAAKAYYERNNVFPIMHVLGIRNELVQMHPWLPGTVLKAFEASKAIALDKLRDTSATKVTLPFVEEQLKAAEEFMGDDFWSYGVRKNYDTLQTFLRHHHCQGLSRRLLSVEELFHPSTFDSYVI